jgi:hypothetical protein
LRLESANGQIGIWLDQRDSTSNSIAILDNFFQSNGLAAFYSTQSGTSDSTLRISRNVVHSSGYGGYAGAQFYTMDSATLDATIDQNRVTGSQSAWQGAIWFRTEDNASARARLSGNSLTGNAGYGFGFQTYDTSTSTVDMGGGSLGATGRNRIFNNAAGDIYNGSGDVIKAENNWWGSAVPSPVFHGGHGGDYDPWLTADPE